MRPQRRAVVHVPVTAAMAAVVMLDVAARAMPVLVIAAQTAVLALAIVIVQRTKIAVPAWATRLSAPSEMPWSTPRWP